jgi:uncharacterized protein YeaO (DUF488 family)
MPGEIRTRRWNDPKKKGDGLRLLVCRFRPRALPKKDETWDEWDADLGPSRELHAAIYGKNGAPISWGEFAKRYVREMKSQRSAIAVLADRVGKGETITLLCSSACEDEGHCHRSLLKGLIEAQI